jgi:L-rhamnose mutarotase
MDKDTIFLSNQLVPKEYPQIWESIPQNIKNLLFYTNEMPPENIDKIGVSLTFSLLEGVKVGKLGVRNDPSTIYFTLPITVPLDKNNVPPPPRYPKYYSITSEQRYIYLNWLKNIDEPIHEGYKQLFFFGLERQLIIGDFDAAWKMILRLRKCPVKNYEFFLFQATDTLFTACMMDRLDLLHKMDYIYDDPFWGDMQILTKYFTREPINVKEVINILNHTDTKNRRYFDNAPEEYAEEMSNILLEKTGRSFILTENYISEEKRKKSHIVLGFHNSSFPFELRNPNILLPDTQELLDFLHEIHPECHERTKERLRKRRKKQ